jgi:hypothetical protein
MKKPAERLPVKRSAQRVPLSELDVLKAVSGVKPFVAQVAAKAPRSGLDPDEALARSYHAGLLAALGPVMVVLDAAKADGYDMTFVLRQNAQGKQELANTELHRIYRFK